MDIASIPRIDSLVLTGLDFSMRPENVQFEVQRGFITPFPEIKVMHQIKSLAVMVYNQEKMTPYYHGNVCDGRNSLAYFICAVHRQTAPQPQTKTHSHSRSNSNSSANSDSSNSSCKSANPGKNCELPKLVTTSMLPLGYWDSLYYALVAEIRLLHSDLQNRFGFGCETATEPLHYCGPDGTTNQPVTAIDFASMLETAWYALMDNRLVATLDSAVRMRRMRENAEKEEIDKATKMFIKEIKSKESKDASVETPAKDVFKLPELEGLMDVNSYSPEAIISMLWDNHAPAINRACCEDFEDESMFTLQRAELHKAQMEANVALSTPLPSASFCTCNRTCVCRLRCDQNTDHCTCLNSRVEVYHLVHEQEKKKGQVRSKYVKQDQNMPNQFLGAATNTLAQMQIAALADPNPVTVQACYNVQQATFTHQRQLVNGTRGRSNTANSDLAYVPASRTPHHGPKDVYPLDFYGRNSPGNRYPTMQASSSAMSSEQNKYIYGPSMASASTTVPSRKPVPAPIKVPPSMVARYRNPYERYQAQARANDTTPPTSSPHDVQTFTQAYQVTYPAIPVSQSQGMFTQSFPVPSTGNPRGPSDDVFGHQTTVQATYTDPAQDYVGLLARHPSIYEPREHYNETFPPLSYEPIIGPPKLSRSPSASPPKKAFTTNALPTLKTFANMKDLRDNGRPPLPALPAPDFIAPRPALKQRYVSAGGNAKLSDRAEIPGPPLNCPLAPKNRPSISKDDVDAKMGDPEFVRQYFGEQAAIAVSLSPPRKRSDESTTAVGLSARSSDESERGKGTEKRDRTSSGAGRTVAKLKRVFSRKNSQNETD